MRITCIFVIAFFCSLSLKAQKFSIGSEIGIISSNDNTYPNTDYQKRRLSYYSGLNFNYKHDENLSFSTGLHYLRQGYRHKTCYIFEEGVKNELVRKLDYLTIPLLINMHFLKSKKLIVSLGVFVAFNVKAVQDYPDKIIGGCEIYYPRDISSTTEDFILNAAAGLGYKFFDNDKINFISSIKYYHSLSNTFKNPFPMHFIDRRYNSILLSLLFNYSL